MRHTSGITPCPLEGEEMTGYDPSNQDRIDSRAFRDDTDIQGNDTRKDGDALDLLGIPSTYEGSDMVGKGGLTEGREAE
jgi:hypothetical protein